MTRLRFRGVRMVAAVTPNVRTKLRLSEGLGVSGMGDLAHLRQDDLLAVLREFVDLVTTALVKRDVAGHKRIRCQLKALDVWMPLLDFMKKRCANALSLIGRLDEDSAYGTYSFFDDAPSRSDDSLPVLGNEYGLRSD